MEKANVERSQESACVCVYAPLTDLSFLRFKHEQTSLHEASISLMIYWFVKHGYLRLMTLKVLMKLME